MQNYIILAWFTNIRKFQLTGVSPKVFHHKIIQISNSLVCHRVGVSSDAEKVVQHFLRQVEHFLTGESS